MENVHCKCKRDNHEVPKHWEYQGIIETNYLKTEKSANIIDSTW